MKIVLARFRVRSVDVDVFNIVIHLGPAIIAGISRISHYVETRDVAVNDRGFETRYGYFFFIVRPYLIVRTSVSLTRNRMIFFFGR